MKIFRFTLFVILAIGEFLCIPSSHSQSRMMSVQVKESGNTTTGYGRDFWFAIPQNADANNHSQIYFDIYITSARNTTVNFQVGTGKITKKPVTAGKVTLFTSPTPKFPGGDISVSTELTSSGVVESEKSVHIWSNDADLSVYFLSRGPYTSDGMYGLPTVGWGKDYVVGAYTSLLVPQNIADFPSEFVIVANQNNTTVTITPSYDLRKDGFPNIIDHVKGIPFAVNLQRGDCIQYQVTGAKTGDEDATGTIITSNNTIGVIGASVCPYINTSDPYCDYIVDMLQPVRSWSNTYYTVPFAGRKYGGDEFLLVGSKDGQMVFRNGIADTLSKYKGYYQDVITNPTLWSSADPFMLVQYIPSSTHGVPPNQQRNSGDPAMVVMNGVDQFRKKVIFQTPTIDLASGQKNYTNYVNIILPASVEGKTTYDGKLIDSSHPGVKNVDKFVIPGTVPAWEAIRFTYNPGIGEGAHTIISDSGVGVYVYGFGTDDSYAWSGQLGTASPHSLDSIPPIAITSNNCLCTHVRIFDTGPNQAKLSSFIEDSLFNMSFTYDPNFIPGAGQDSSYYDLCVLDPSLEAYISVSIYDIAGNRTTVTSTYKPHFVKFAPKSVDFGSIAVGDSAFKYDTICNTGIDVYNFRSADLALSSASSGFTIDSIGADGAIAQGGCRVIKLKFVPQMEAVFKDTLTLTDSCIKFTSVLSGNGGVPDFTLSDFDFGCISIGETKVSDSVIITNIGLSSITIDSVYLDDNIHFFFDTTLLKFIFPTKLQPNDKRRPLNIGFTPDKTGSFTTIIHFHSKEAGWKTATLIGCGQEHVSVSTERYASSLSKESSEYSLLSSRLDKGELIAILPPVPNPATHDNNSVRFVFGLSISAPLKLSLYDLLGKETAVIFDDNFSAGIYESRFTLPANLSAGSYIYRLSGNSSVRSGKLVILR